MRQGCLRKNSSPEYIWRKTPLLFLFLFLKFSGVSSCQWGYSTQGALHALGLAGLRRAEQSRAEPRRAQQSQAKCAISLDPLLISGSSCSKQGAPTEMLPSSTSPFCPFALAEKQHFSNQQMSTPFFFRSPLHFPRLDASVGITCIPLLRVVVGYWWDILCAATIESIMYLQLILILQVCR